jgi:hypothetical protein
MNTLRKLPTGEWAIQAPGREPVRIVAGDLFFLEVQRVMRRAHDAAQR